jgi:Family of unknown function (DUF6174)
MLRDWLCWRPLRRHCQVRMKCIAVFTCCLFAMSGCATEPPQGPEYHVSRDGKFHDDALGALAKAEALWAAAQIHNYSYDIRRGGVFGGSVYRLSFKGGSCKASYVKDVGLPDPVTCDGNSMPELFAELRAELARGNEDVFASFDPARGFVRHFSVEPHTAAGEDQGWGVELSHFRVLN